LDVDLHESRQGEARDQRIERRPGHLDPIFRPLFPQASAPLAAREPRPGESVNVRPWSPLASRKNTSGTAPEHFGPGTAAGSGKEVSRGAALVFFLGTRHFGVVTSHLPGPNVRALRFTSALPTHILSALKPAFAPILSGEPSLPIPDPQTVVAENADARATAAPPARQRQVLVQKRSRPVKRAPKANTSSVRRTAPRIMDDLF
jgi:hypothetical protein